MNHIPAKKSLGQNFLKSEKALNDIVDAADLEPGDIVLEVGPGKGALTKKLLEAGGKVIAVEKDDRLITTLEETFSEAIANGTLSIIHSDILEFDPKAHGLAEHSYKLVANIPYYITGILLRRFLSETIQPARMVLMLQKEVAERIVARDGKESLLSIAVKVYGTPKYIGKVAARYFSPQPKVDSAIILIENISKEFFQDVSEQRFFEVVKRGFEHKRKMLIGNIRALYKNKDLETLFNNVSIQQKARAEDLTLEQWKKLILS